LQVLVALPGITAAKTRSMKPLPLLSGKVAPVQPCAQPQVAPPEPRSARHNSFAAIDALFGQKGDSATLRAKYFAAGYTFSRELTEGTSMHRSVSLWVSNR
jgi:hypothetical protein